LMLPSRHDSWFSSNEMPLCWFEAKSLRKPAGN
jgi:hypothetical protein